MRGQKEIGSLGGWMNIGRWVGGWVSAPTFGGEGGELSGLGGVALGLLLLFLHLFGVGVWVGE